MTAYIDSSLVLRIVLGEPEPLEQWRALDRALSSELIQLECFRTIDRARIRLGLPDHEVAERRAAIAERLETFDIVRLDRRVIARAAEPFPTTLGTLDALHLATALLARTRHPGLIVATHDGGLATAAKRRGGA